jgi:Bacterial PH domain
LRNRLESRIDRQNEEWAMGLLSRLLGHASDVTPEETREDLEGILLPEEPVEVAFKVMRDMFVFTDKRLILVDKQGLTSSKVDYLVVPYRAITSYSIETAGTLDTDSELKIWISGRTEPIQKTLKRGANIRGIQAAIAAAL